MKTSTLRTCLFAVALVCGCLIAVLTQPISSHLVSAAVNWLIRYTQEPGGVLHLLGSVWGTLSLIAWMIFAFLGPPVISVRLLAVAIDRYVPNGPTD